MAPAVSQAGSVSHRPLGCEIVASGESLMCCDGQDACCRGHGEHVSRHDALKCLVFCGDEQLLGLLDAAHAGGGGC